MLNKLHYFLILFLFVFLVPVRGMSQTDDVKTTTTASAHHTHVVKKTWNGTKRAVSKDVHATARATGKAWRATKHGVAKGYQATARATSNAWRGTKKAATKGYNNTVHPHAKVTHRSRVKQPDQIKQESETK
jgi:hypothetical protein